MLRGLCPFSDRETPEQIADSVAGGEVIHPQERLQGSITAHPVGVREALGAHQHRHENAGNVAVGSI